MVEEKRHCRFSASKSKTWLACPASITLSEAAPKPPDHPAAVEGTLTHECLEEFHNSQIAPKLLMRHLQITHPIDRVNRAYNAFMRLKDIEKEYPGCTGHAEVEVDTSYFLAPGSFGTVDRALTRLFDTLVIADYKNGVMPVPAEDNTQLIIYALGFAKRFEFNFEKVRLLILQPNSRSQKGRESSCIMPMRELRSWEKVFREGVKRCLEPKPKVVKGEWCFFCPARKHNCPAHQEDRRKLLDKYF